MQRYFFLPVACVAAGLVAIAFVFGERFAVDLVAGFAAGFALAAVPFFFGDCFAVDFVAVDVAAALMVAVRFLGERVAVVGVVVFFVVCFVAILVAPDVGRLVP
ncbi:MAG: hypothetical protein O3C40_32410 [Planctomycetota bacterium]|nr:hypothetical protein [Planctomycetota bacterium]